MKEGRERVKGRGGEGKGEEKREGKRGIRGKELYRKQKTGPASCRIPKTATIVKLGESFKIYPLIFWGRKCTIKSWNP